MKHHRIKLITFALFVMFTAASFASALQAEKAKGKAARNIPRTWDEAGFAGMDLPLADPTRTPTHVSADYYYKIPVMQIYKSYPIYAPDKEPPGYMDWLKQQEPEIAFDASKLETEEDWIKAGELVFEAPITYNALNKLADVRNPEWYKKSGMPLSKDGIMPFNRYVVSEKGVVDVGEFSCATCHTRVMPDGTVIKGAQGNYPLGRLDELFARSKANPNDEKRFFERARFAWRLAYVTPWLKPDPMEEMLKMSVDEVASVSGGRPPGVQSRTGTSLIYPVAISDLIGVKDRRYLDRTGLQLHRSIGDMMRYAALNQGASFFDRYGDFLPYGELPDPNIRSRYSDEQLYALTLYLYSLKPPPNPNKFDALAARGQKIFQREGCAGCHTPPLYTNNKLTPVEGFKVPEQHLKQFDILPYSVETDPNLALKTRRGTGYYKVPSLKGVWYRGPFEHSGSVATLEDWFDPRRTRDDYVPTGFRGVGVKTRALKGHRFGLDLSDEDRKALIAFLKTL